MRNILLKEDEATPVVRKAARALAALHLDRVPTKVPLYRLRDEFPGLVRSGNLLRQRCPHLGSRIENIVAAIVASLKDGPSAPTHGDLKLEHILLDGDRFALIDLDDFGEADPVLDIANILAYIAALPRNTPICHDRARTATRVFAEEYFTHVPQAWRTRLPIHYARALFFVAIASPENNIEPLVKEAEESLAGRIW